MMVQKPSFDCNRLSRPETEIETEHLEERQQWNSECEVDFCGDRAAGLPDRWLVGETPEPLKRWLLSHFCQKPYMLVRKFQLRY